jgi:hypothetical protein
MVLAWDIFMTMEMWAVQTVVQKAKEQYPAAYINVRGWYGT